MSAEIILKVLGFSSLEDLNRDKCESIKNLDLSDKHLNNLDGCGDIFKHLPNLKYLYLYNNQLTSLDRDIFKYLSKLEYLNLDNNQLASLDRDIFKYLPKLEYLDLGNNQLASLDRDIFKYLPKLEYLDLGKNQLASLDRDIFKHSPKLEYLNLGNNKLKSLKNIPQNIKYFYYDKNPLTEYPRNERELKECNRQVGLQKIRNVFLKQYIKQIVTNYWYAPSKEILEKDGITFTLVSRYCIFCKKEQNFLIQK